MSQPANVLMMPNPSDKNSSSAQKEAASAGHRSPVRAVAAEVSSIAGDARATQAEPSTEVFAVFGVAPEIQAYAMAKYSRSALSMKESLREISTQKAEKFLNTF